MKIKIFHIIYNYFFIIFLFFIKVYKILIFILLKLILKKNIPSFEAKIFDTNKIISSEEIFKDDKFYLVNIWASWCVPCRDEHPFLMNLSNQKNIEIIGLNYKDNNKMLKIF